MSSGCIISMDCPVCSDIVYEDEWDIIDDVFIHETCRGEYIKSKYHINGAQFEKLYRAKQLQEEITALREWTDNRIGELEQKLMDLQGH